MFSAQSNATDENLFGMLRHYAKTGSHKMMENVQAELWRRNISQEKYIAWLKSAKEKEKE